MFTSSILSLRNTANVQFVSTPEPIPDLSHVLTHLINSQLHWAKYKDTHNKVNSELHKAKKRYFCDKFEDCAQTKDPKQSWHHINHLLGKNFKSNNIPQSLY